MHGSNAGWGTIRGIAALACALAAAFGALAAAPRVARASPQELFGFGARTPGLASMGVSFVDDYEAVYVNPAGLGRVRHRSLVLGVQLGGYALELDGRPFAVEPVRATTIGATLPLPFGGVMRDRLALALGFYTPTAVVITGDLAFADVPRFLVLDRAQSAAIQIGLGVDLHGVVDGLRVGAAVSAIGAFAGSIVAGIDATGRFGSVVETQVLAAYAPVVGASYDVGDFSFGFVWRGKIQADYVFEIVTRDLPLTVPVLTVGGIAQYDPHTLAAEASWRPAEGSRLAVGLQYALWSDYPGPLSQTSRSSDPPPAPEFTDTFGVRASFEQKLRRASNTWSLRGGYAFLPSPAPPATARRRYLDGDRHQLTLGLGLDVATGAGAHVFLDGYVSAILVPERVHDAPQEGGAENMRTGGFAAVGGWAAGVRW
jgi:long-chain fatty acid transport protein